MSSEKSLLRAFVGTAGLQLVGRGLTVVTGIIFARALGPEEFGRYSLVISIVLLVTLPSIAGMSQLIVRETARYRSEEKNSLMLGVWRWATSYMLAISTFSICIALGLIFFEVWPESVSSLLCVGLILVPLKGALALWGASINGLKRPELAQVPVIILAPIIALLILSILYFNDISIDSQRLLLLQVMTHLVACIVSFYLLKRLTKRLSIKGKPESLSSQWRSALLPFTILVLVSTMNNELATLMLGFFGNEAAIGYFKVAMQGITLLALGLQAANIVSGPRIAALYKQNKIEQTQALLTQSVKLSVATSLPFALVLILFGDFLVRLMFGEAYLPAAELLVILCIGQIVNVCMGSVGLVLNMTGNEKRTLRAQAITLIITIGLLFLLIPVYQAKGAAIAVSVGLVAWNLIMAFDVYRLTGLKTWIKI